MKSSPADHEQTRTPFEFPNRLQMRVTWTLLVIAWTIWIVGEYRCVQVERYMDSKFGPAVDVVDSLSRPPVLRPIKEFYAGVAAIFDFFALMALEGRRFRKYSMLISVVTVVSLGFHGLIWSVILLFKY